MRNLEARPAMAQAIQVVILLLFCASCSRATSVKEAVMASTTLRLEAIFGKTRTVCFGRFLVDVPASATVVYGEADVNWSIYRAAGDGVKLEERVRQQLGAIENERYLVRGKMVGPESLLGRVFDGRSPGQKLVFGESQGIAYRIYSYFRLGDDLFVQEAQALLEKSVYTDAIADLNTIATKLRHRTADDIPSEPGMCIDGGFMPETSGLTHERVTLGVRLVEFPDVHFSIAVTKKDRVVQSDALEPRLAEAEVKANAMGKSSWYSSIKVLRRGERQVGKWKGFEILARKPPQDEDEESHEFAFLSQGEPANPLLPVLDVKLDTGVKGNVVGAKRPSVTDDEAIEIWDRVIRTIRVRPTGQGKAEVSPVRAAMDRGTFGTAGETCAQSGWWLCSAGAGKVDVVGGQLQYLRAGERLPQASLLLPATMWQKIRRERTSVETTTPSNWKLIDRRRHVRTPPSPLLARAEAPKYSVEEQLEQPGREKDEHSTSAAVGVQIASGAICPASGWWRCLAPDALDGTRWFAEGGIVPPATAKVSRTLLDKIKGKRAVVRAPALWQLVRFALSATPGGSATVLALGQDGSLPLDANMRNSAEGGGAREA